MGAIPLPASLAQLSLFSVATSNTAASITASTTLSSSSVAPTLAQASSRVLLSVLPLSWLKNIFGEERAPGRQYGPTQPCGGHASTSSSGCSPTPPASLCHGFSASLDMLQFAPRIYTEKTQHALICPAHHQRALAGWLESDNSSGSSDHTAPLPATVMSLCTGQSKLCKHCRVPDHADAQCAL